MEQRTLAAAFANSADFESTIARCHARLVRRNNSASGVLSLDISASPRGVVTESCLVRSTVNDDDTVVCILRASLHLKVENHVDQIRLNVAFR